MLLRIDATDYENEVEKALNQVELRQNQIDQLKISYDRDKGRLFVVKQNTTLARSNFLRLKTLL